MSLDCHCHVQTIVVVADAVIAVAVFLASTASVDNVVADIVACRCYRLKKNDIEITFSCSRGPT